MKIYENPLFIDFLMSVYDNWTSILSMIVFCSAIYPHDIRTKWIKTVGFTNICFVIDNVRQKRQDKRHRAANILILTIY